MPPATCPDSRPASARRTYGKMIDRRAITAVAAAATVAAVVEAGAALLSRFGAATAAGHRRANGGPAVGSRRPHRDHRSDPHVAVHAGVPDPPPPPPHIPHVALPMSAPHRQPVMHAATVLDTRSRTRYPGELTQLLRHVDSWPYLQTDCWPNGATFHVRDHVVGRLTFRTGELSLDVPPDMVRLLLDGHPQLAKSQEGVTLQITDIDSRTAAEALLRWRIGLDRFAYQQRAASP